MKKPIRVFFLTIGIIDVITLIFFITFSRSAYITEKHYSTGIYPFIATIFGRIWDLIPFSVSEVIIISFVVISLVLLIRLIVMIKSGLVTVSGVFKRIAGYLFVVISIGLCWFNLTWGFNYLRMGFTYERIEESRLTDDQFDRQFERLLYFTIDRVNELYQEIPHNREQYDSLIYDALVEIMNEYTGRKFLPAQKVKYLTTGMLYRTNTLGVVSPFTLESHLSRKIFDCEYPFTLAHEKVHLFGFGNETEANFIAFLTCIETGDRYCMFSAYIEILPYLLVEYRERHTEDEYQTLYKTIREEVRMEFTKQKERYQKHSSKLNDKLWDLYDLYLRVNNVEGGNMAYSMVAVMLVESAYADRLIHDYNY